MVKEKQNVASDKEIHEFRIYILPKNTDYAYERLGKHVKNQEKEIQMAVAKKGSPTTSR